MNQLAAKTAKVVRRKKRKKPEPPAIGALVNYAGRTGKTLGKGAALRVVAEARGKRFIVEAMTLDGKVVRRNIKMDNLVERQPDLFSDLPQAPEDAPMAIRRRR